MPEFVEHDRVEIGLACDRIRSDAIRIERWRQAREGVVDGVQELRVLLRRGVEEPAGAVANPVRRVVRIVAASNRRGAFGRLAVEDLGR